MQNDRSQDLARTTFQLLALGALIATSFWIVRPFLVASAWATTLVVATWPLLLNVQAWLGGRRSLAVTVTTIALLLIRMHRRQCAKTPTTPGPSGGLAGAMR